MDRKVIAIYGSPRKGGNTRQLLDAFLKGTGLPEQAITRVDLGRSKITPCLEYYACVKTGHCSIKDEMTPLYEVLETADIVALASPIFFYGITAQAKALIDRCQVFWARKYLLKDKFTGSRVQDSARKRRGIFISTAATKGAKVFDGALLTVHYFFDALGISDYDKLLFRLSAEHDNIKEHPTALTEAYEAGQKAVRESL